MSRMVRYRMFETGERYTAALAAVRSDPQEIKRLKAALRSEKERQRYPFTDRDGLDGRHVLSGFETQRRTH